MYRHPMLSSRAQKGSPSTEMVSALTSFRRPLPQYPDHEIAKTKSSRDAKRDDAESETEGDTIFE